MTEPETTASREGLLGDSYAYYEALLRSINENHPQHQGMAEDEFEKVIGDVRTVSSTLRVGDREIIIPQLVPVEGFKWLHSEYYLKHYSDEYARDDLMHFTFFDGLQPSPEIGDRIMTLAASGGLLAVDHPSIQSGYIKSVTDYLDSIDVGYATPHHIGTQTYFAAPIHYKIMRERLEPSVNMIEAYSRLKEKFGDDEKWGLRGTTLETIIEGEEADLMSSFFTAAYDTISDHPCHQSISPEEFRGMLLNPAVAKIIKRKNNVPETLCLITDDLGSLDWVNASVYEKKFPEKYREKKVVWFPGIATDPDPLKTGKNVPDIVGLIASLCEVGNYEMVVVYDSPDINTGFLDSYLSQEINKTPEFSTEFMVLGEQNYSIIRLSDRK